MRNPVPVENETSLEAVHYPSTTQLQRLFNSSLDIICSVNLEKKIVHINDACRNLLGYSPEEMTGRYLLDFIYEEDWTKTVAVEAAIFYGDNKVSFENRYYHKNGSVVFLHWSCYWDATENLMFCIGRDTTGRNSKEVLQAQYEERVKKQNREMQDMLERMTDCFFAMDDEWRIIYANTQCGRTLGLNIEDYLSRSLWECFPDMVGTIFYEEYKKAMQQKVSVHFTAYLHTFNNWLEVHAYPSDTGLSVFFRDISQEKRSADELRLSHERFRLAAKTDAIYDFDLGTNYLFWGEGLTDLFGYTADELQIEQWAEALDPNERKCLTEDFYQTLADKDKDTWEKEYRIKKKDSTYCYVFERGFIMRDSEGNATRMVGVMQDISKRKNAEEELRKLSLIVKETMNAVIVTDVNHRIAWVNDSFTKMSGYSFQEAVGKLPGALLDCPDTDPSTLKFIREKTRKGEAFQTQVLNRTKENGRRWWEVYYQPVYNERGEVIQYFSICTDITERRRLEKELATQQKKITSAVIAAQERERAIVSQELHDSVNPTLTTVKLYQDVILTDTANQKELINKSKCLLQRSISEIRCLSKRLSPPTLELYSLVDSIKELIDNVAATDQFEVILDTECIEELKVSEELHLALYRIVQEQLTNILKYAKASCVQVVFEVEKEHLLMIIADDGRGFNVEQKRSGIGITNMTMRAESLHGSLTFDSAPGKGCVLLAAFPLDQ